ncbi:MAG: hypothetical protein H6Q78_927, partial [Candidatus Krumholzibacteriota bacterium]|nr:hypothetical protein [Candidatus Krumholzibacteriota bacterium]
MRVLRRSILAIVCVLFVSGPAAAAPEKSAAPDRLRAAFEGLDPAGIPTGVLYDRVVSLSRALECDGSPGSPSVGPREWRQMLFEMSNAALEKPTWRTVGEIDTRAKEMTRAGIVPVAFLNIRYDRIKPAAFEDGSIAVRDGRMVLSKGDPFETKRLFAVSALKGYTHRGQRVVFSFDRRFYVANDGDAPLGLEADFDDGLGWRRVGIGGDETVGYSLPGTKTVRTRMTLASGEVLRGAFEFSVENLQTPNPDDTLGITAAIPYNAGYGTGEAYVYLGAGHSTIVNPAIVVEGFDLDNTMNWDELYQLLNQENLLETLRAKGFDAVVLNFTDATDYVQRNSFVVVELINEIRALLSPHHDIALVGGSMGALCARYALAYMETASLPHGVRTFISFDGPQAGANIPLGVQYWLDFFSDLSTDAAFLLSRLDTPAARQLLVYHHTTPPGATGESDPLRAAMLADFAAAGGYPALPRKVAVANGSGAQAGQGFSAGDQIIRYEFGGWPISIRGNVWAVPDAVSRMIFDGRIVIFVPTDQLSVTVSGTRPYDNAPGGRRNSMAQMDSTQAPYGDIIALYDNHCFIPTVSALDLATNDLFYDVDGDPNLLLLTPFDAVYFPAENQDHMAITAQTAGWLIAELESGVTSVETPIAPPVLELSAPLPNPASSAVSIRYATGHRGPV